MADPRRPMECLQEHVPLALIIDMLDQTGPDSATIYEQEHADTTWVPHLDEPRLGEPAQAAASPRSSSE